MKGLEFTVYLKMKMQLYIHALVQCNMHFNCLKQVEIIPAAEAMQYLPTEPCWLERLIVERRMRETTSRRGID